MVLPRIILTVSNNMSSTRKEAYLLHMLTYTTKANAQMILRKTGFVAVAHLIGLAEVSCDQGGKDGEITWHRRSKIRLAYCGSDISRGQLGRSGMP